MLGSPYTFDALNADVILRAPLKPGSGEFKDFHTHKIILSIASTVFHDMFSIPQPPQPVGSDTVLPAVQVAETAGVFETFLRLIYPIEPPAVNSLQLVDDLFRLAEKYMASGVHAKLRQILPSPSFLKNDPIWVYAIACRADFNEEAELAIRHASKVDPVHGISRKHLQMMTAEAYNRLLISHTARRDELLSALSQVRLPPGRLGKCGCGGWFYTRLHKDITLAIWKNPFLDRRRLDSCLSDFKNMPKSECGLGSSCRVSVDSEVISGYFAGILDKIGKLGQISEC